MGGNRWRWDAPTTEGPTCNKLVISAIQNLRYLEFFYEAITSESKLSLPLQTKIQHLESQLIATLVFSLSRSGGRFVLVVGERTFRQTTCEFMLTFASMQGKNMDEYMTNLASEYDQVRVPLSGCGKSITLSLTDFTRLRSLYGQGMFELKLQDLLMRQGIATEEAISRQALCI
jgi:hypothetical protein